MKNGLFGVIATFVLLSVAAFSEAATTDHIVEYVPQSESAEIRIVAFDEFDKEYFSVTTRVE